MPGNFLHHLLASALKRRLAFCYSRVRKKYFRWMYIFCESLNELGWFMSASATNNRTKGWKNWFHRTSITHFTSTLSGMAGKSAVRKTRNAINALWSSSVITDSLSFDSASTGRDWVKNDQSLILHVPFCSKIVSRLRLSRWRQRRPIDLLKCW